MARVLRNFVIEGMACHCQATPPLQTSLARTVTKLNIGRSPSTKGFAVEDVSFDWCAFGSILNVAQLGKIQNWAKWATAKTDALGCNTFSNQTPHWTEHY